MSCGPWPASCALCGDALRISCDACGSFDPCKHMVLAATPATEARPDVEGAAPLEAARAKVVEALKHFKENGARIRKAADIADEYGYVCVPDSDEWQKVLDSLAKLDAAEREAKSRG